MVAQRPDPGQGAEVGDGHPADRARLSAAGLRGAAHRLPQPEGEQTQDQPRDGSQVEGRTPAQPARDQPAAGKAHRDAEVAARAPDRHGAAAGLLREVIAEQGSPGREVARLSDAEQRPGGKELGEAAGQPREQGGDAPDADADTDHVAANSPVAPDPEGKSRDGVDQQKSSGQRAETGVRQVELPLDGDGDRRQHVAVDVIEEDDPDHHRQRVARVALRHGDLQSSSLRSRAAFSRTIFTLASGLSPIVSSSSRTRAGAMKG